MTEHAPMDRAAYSGFETVSIRFSDQDPMGHVNNVAVAAFFESGRVSFINRLADKIDFEGTGMVLAHLSVDYRREVTYPGTVEVGGRLTAVGGRSFSLAFALYQHGELAATSTAVMVFFDKKTRRSASPPERVREALRAELERQP